MLKSSADNSDSKLILIFFTLSIMGIGSVILYYHWFFHGNQGILESNALYQNRFPGNRI